MGLGSEYFQKLCGPLHIYFAMNVSMPRAMRNGYYDEVLARGRSLPGVTGAGLAELLPLAGDRSSRVLAKGNVYSTTPVPEAFVRFVTNGYSASMGILCARVETFRRQT
jgi:hypothetical protein